MHSHHQIQSTNLHTQSKGKIVSLQPGKFISRPRPAEAYKVDAENMAIVAAWCGGKIIVPDAEKPEVLTTLAGAALPTPAQATRAYIQLPEGNGRVANKSWLQARVGDYVVKQGRKFKKFTADAFEYAYQAAQAVPSLPYAVPNDGTVLEAIGTTPIFDQMMAEVRKGVATQTPPEVVAANLTTLVRENAQYEPVNLNASSQSVTFSEEQVEYDMEMDRQARLRGRMQSTADRRELARSEALESDLDPNLAVTDRGAEQSGTVN
jgi:hypothetical protein